MKNPDPPSPPGGPPAIDQEFAELTLEDTAALRRRGVGVSTSTPPPTNPRNGYNPYDVAPDVVARGAQAAKTPGKKTDLRKLSEWIQLQQRVAQLKDKGDDDPK